MNEAQGSGSLGLSLFFTMLLLTFSLFMGFSIHSLL